MDNALAWHAASGGPLLPSVQETALRLALEEAQLLAAKSKLLALNAAFESAGAGREAGLAQEMDTLGSEAGQAMAEADKIVAAVELLLQQIQSASSLARP